MSPRVFEFSSVTILCLCLYWLIAVTYTVVFAAWRARQSWSQLNAALIARNALVPALIKLIDLKFVFDHQTIRQLTLLTLPRPQGETEVRRVRDLLENGAAIEDALRQVRGYPDFKGELKLADLAKRIAPATQAVNDAVTAYNTAALEFNHRRHDFAACTIARFIADMDLPTFAVENQRQ